MDPAQGVSPISYLDDLASNGLYKSDNTLNENDRLALIFYKIKQLDNNLDFIISSSTLFPGTGKKLKRVFKNISKEIEKDKIVGHQLALKCHAIISKIQEKKPELLDFNNIPQIFAEEHYDAQASNVTLMEDLLGFGEPASKLDLYHLAGTDKAKAVEDDFLKQVAKLPYPLENNALELIDTYHLLSIASQKEYPRLARACLKKLTTQQIFSFLSITYAPEKQAVKKIVVDNLKEIQREDPKLFQRILFKMSDLVDRDLKAGPWNEHELQLANELLDIAFAIKADNVVKKVYEKLNQVNFTDPTQLKKICTTGHFPPFAGQFALYYILSKHIFPENYSHAMANLNALIERIFANRRDDTPPKKDEFFIPLTDKRFIKQLVDPIVELKDWKIPKKAKSEDLIIYLTHSSLTKEDVEQLAFLEPKEFTAPQVILASLGEKHPIWKSKERTGKEFLGRLLAKK